MTARRRPGSRGGRTHGQRGGGPTHGIAAWVHERLDIAAIIAAAQDVLGRHGVGDATAPPAAAMARLTWRPDQLAQVLAAVPRHFELAADPRALDHRCIIGAPGLAPVLAPGVSADWLIDDRGDRCAVTAAAVRDVMEITRCLDELMLSASGLWLGAADVAPRDRLVAFAAADGRPLVADLSGHGIAGARLQPLLSAVAAARGDAPAADPTRPVARLLGIVAIDRALHVAPETMDTIAAMAAGGEALVVAPTLILGANCPADVAGALVRFAAEVMAVAAIAQRARPGAIVVAGVRVAEASMRTGMPMVGTAAVLRATAGAIAVARLLGLPVAVLGPATGCKMVDARAASDTALWLSVAAAADVIIGAAGALDLDCAIGLDKLVLDCDLLSALFAADDRQDDGGTLDIGGPAGAPAALADRVIAIGAGGNALAAPATRAVTSARRPLRLADEWLYETWDAAGRPDSKSRAAHILADLRARGGTDRSGPADTATTATTQRVAAVTAAVDAALAAVPASTGTAHTSASDIRTADIRTENTGPTRLATLASELYSAAMRDAFGFKG